ncbi:MAG TPA: alternative ribosome rescue aminoacyl-tRNA hydrolase ArfB [Gemmataceae bacterium]|nr:alternative ribosome rescue aminoacyl-tRNA hydrolase ArfB [Gemmataceae bacterium]
MLEIDNRIRISDEELSWTFVRAGGPGGQNVNKVASKAVLRWNVVASSSLPDDIKDRLRKQQGRRITSDGDLLLTSQRYRDQERNKLDCLEKLAEMLRAAAVTPKVRRKTKPSRGSKERRLAAKKRRSALKESRRGQDE